MFNTLAAGSDNSYVMVLVLAGIGGAIAVIAIVSSAIQDALKTRQVERTKRELAAYVAEGSMSADDAYKIVSGGGCGSKPGGCACRTKA